MLAILPWCGGYHPVDTCYRWQGVHTVSTGHSAVQTPGGRHKGTLILGYMAKHAVWLSICFNNLMTPKTSIQ